MISCQLRFSVFSKQSQPFWSPKWMKKRRWGSFGFLQYLSEILSTFSLNFGDRHLYLGRLKCHTNRLEKSQIKMGICTPNTISWKWFLPAFHPSNFQFFLCLSSPDSVLACIFRILNWQQPHPLQPHFHAWTPRESISLPRKLSIHLSHSTTTASTTLRQKMLNLEFAMIQNSDT